MFFSPPADKKIMKMYYLVFLTFFLSCSIKKTSSLDPSIKKRAQRAPSSYTFGGSCVSEGTWVNQALSASRELQEAIGQLKEKEECKDLYNFYQSMNVTNTSLSHQSLKDQSNIDLAELTHSFSPSSSNNMLEAILGKTLERTYNEIEFNRKNPAPPELQDYGLKYLNGFLNILPSSQSCLQDHPSFLETFAISSVKLASAYTGAPSFISGFDQTITNLLSFLGNKKYENALARINQSEYINSLSCIIESTTTSFCSALDTKIMLEEVANYQNEISDEIKQESNPLEGYLILTRDVRTISDWLLKVMFGVNPKTLQDADYKNNILKNITNYLEDINTMIARLNNDETDFKAQGDRKAQQTFLLGTILKLVDILDGDFRDKKNGGVNFFTWIGIPVLEFPYRLIGIKKLPASALSSGENPQPLSFSEYAQFMGTGKKADAEWIQEFKNPEALFGVVKANLLEMQKLADAQARNYFRNRFIIDTPNLVTEAITNPRLTVKQALTNTRDYMLRVFKEYETNAIKNDKNFNIEILGFIASTIEDINSILDAFNELQELVKKDINFRESLIEEGKRLTKLKRQDLVDCQITTEVVSLPSLEDVNKPNTDKISEIKEKAQIIKTTPLNCKIKKLATNKGIDKAYSKIIDVVYDKFNILLQRDTYLQTRVETMVKFEFANKLNNGENLNDFYKYLLVIAGNDVLEEVLGPSYTDDPNKINQQLDSAMVIHKENLRALEETFIGPLLGVIRHKVGIENGDKHATAKHLIKDSLNAPMGLYELAYNSTINKDHYFFENFSLRKPDYLSDYFGSSEQLISRFCIQSLAFSRKDKFAEVCKNRILESPNGRFEQIDGKPLSERYDRLIQIYAKRLRAYNKEKTERNKYKLAKIHDQHHICGFRNFLRRNSVYTLLKDFQEDREQRQEESSQ